MLPVVSEAQERERERLASIARMDALLETLWKLWAVGEFGARSRILEAADLRARLSGDSSKLIQAQRLLGVGIDESE